MYSIRCERVPLAHKRLSEQIKRDGWGKRRGGWRREPVLSSERVQKEGSGRCAADAGRKVRKRNEKECNKLAVRLFSTCIKTSSGATDDLGSIAQHFPRPLHETPLSSHRTRVTPTTAWRTAPRRVRPARSTALQAHEHEELIKQRCERVRLNLLTGLTTWFLQTGPIPQQALSASLLSCVIFVSNIFLRFLNYLKRAI